MRRIAAMPALRELELKDCTIDAALLRELPEALTSFVHSGPDLDAAGVQALRRLGNLRTLRLHQSGTTDEDRAAMRREVAGLLGSLHLQRFTWRGQLSPELRQAVAAQGDLRELELDGDDFAFAAALPKLERLDLWPRIEAPKGVGPMGPRSHQTAVPPPTAELEALRASKAMRVLAYHDVRVAADVAERIRLALWPRIALHIVE
jgi:hypothetical protein